MELVRSNQSEVKTSNGYTTTLLAQVNFDSKDKTSRIVEDPNLHGDEAFVKLVVAPNNLANALSSSISLIRSEVDVASGLEKTYYDTYPVSIDEDGSILLDSNYYLEDTALLTVTPFMEEWLKELYDLAKETLYRMHSESVSLSESLSLSESESLSVYHSESLSESESLSISESQSISESFSMSTSASLESHSTSMSNSISEYAASVSTSVSTSLSLIESEVLHSLSVSMSELTSTEEEKVFDSLSAYAESETSSYKTLESLALELEPIRLAYELGEVSTGDLLEQMNREVALPTLKDDISSALDYVEEPTEALEGIFVEDDEPRISSEDSHKHRGLFGHLFGKKKDSYTDLIAEETSKQLEAVNNPSISVKKPTEIEIGEGAYKIEIED